MKRSKKVWLIPLVIVLLLVACFAYWVDQQRRNGWYEGSFEEGIAGYMGAEEENVQIQASLQDASFLYAVWEDRSTKEISMTILQKRKCFGREYLRAWGGMELDETQHYGAFWTGESCYPQAKSLIVAVCDNRNGTIDHCELSFSRFYDRLNDPQFAMYPNGQTWTETIPLDGPFMLQVYWFPDNVRRTGGAAFDHEGNLVEYCCS